MMVKFLLLWSGQWTNIWQNFEMFPGFLSTGQNRKFPWYFTLSDDENTLKYLILEQMRTKCIKNSNKIFSPSALFSFNFSEGLSSFWEANMFHMFLIYMPHFACPCLQFKRWFQLPWQLSTLGLDPDHPDPLPPD